MTYAVLDDAVTLAVGALFKKSLKYHYRLPHESINLVLHSFEQVSFIYHHILP